MASSVSNPSSSIAGGLQCKITKRGQSLLRCKQRCDCNIPVSGSQIGGAMKISARNRLKGQILEVRKGATTTHVRVDIGGQIVTASITNEAAEELALAPGKSAVAVIKASDVMVGV